MTVSQLTPDAFRLIERIARALPPADSGFEINEAITWQETVEPPVDAIDFATETVYVICNSGMKHSVARKIYDRVHEALTEGRSAATVFGHAGKTAAIDRIWRERDKLHAGFSALQTDAERLEFLAALPWIGAITNTTSPRISESMSPSPTSICNASPTPTAARSPTCARNLPPPPATASPR